MDAATIEHEAMGLTAAERAVLAERLLLTLDIEDAGRMERWGREAESRLHAFDRGDIFDADGPSAVASIRKKLG